MGPVPGICPLWGRIRDSGGARQNSFSCVIIDLSPCNPLLKTFRPTNKRSTKPLFLNGKILTHPVSEPESEPKPGNHRLLALIVLIACLLRLSVTPFRNFENLMV